MGGKSSTPNAADEQKFVPDFEYKGKPYPQDLPNWFKTISLENDELAHLKTKTNPRTQQDEIRFMHDIPQRKMNAELARKVALDCGKRCTFSYTMDDFHPSQEQLVKNLNYAEQICSSRCVSKYM